MNKESFEAAVYYDLFGLGQPPSLPRAYLVLDMEDGSGYFCSLTDSGLPGPGTMLSCPVHPRSQALQAIARELGVEDMEILEQALQDQDRQIQTRLTQYYRSDKMMDPAVLSLLEAELTCSQLEQAYAPGNQAREAMLSSLPRLLSGIPEEAMQIILLGRFSYAEEYALREFLSGDPLLPDPRFRRNTYPHTDREILKLGRARMQEHRELGRSLDLLVNTREGTETISLAAPSQSLAALAQPTYFGPVLLGEALTLSLDGQIRQISLRPQEQGTLADLGAAWEDGKLLLCLRNSLLPEQVRREPLDENS